LSVRLPPPAHARLVKLAGMLGSSFDGERANAARMATDILREHGTTWAEVLNPSCPPCPTCAARTAQQERSETYRDARSSWTRSSYTSSWRELAWYCQDNADLLSPWERSFIASILQRWRLTPRQEDVLDRIVEKLEEAGR
jgi:hypothetical protein